MERLKVLIVEDDDVARRQLVRVVSKEGFDCINAEDGKVGLELYEKEKPDIIISDLKMPNVSGLDVLKTVKEKNKDVQFIIITAFSEKDSPIVAIREGALDYIKKPLDLDQLCIALGRAREKIYDLKSIETYPTLLLAEDNEDTRKRLERVLKGEGWRIFSVKDGEEALEVFKREKIDILLLDINMPKKNGLELLHEVKTISTDFEVMILTGYGDESNAIQALREGAFNFIRKPVDLDELIIMIHKAISKLFSERSLKYRTRELELTRQIVAKFTKEREFVVDVRNHTRKGARDYAREIMELLPMGIVVFDSFYNIEFLNENTGKFFENTPEKINDDFLNVLGDKMGVSDISIEMIKASVEKIKASKPGWIERIQTGKYSYVVLFSVSVLTEEELLKDFLMIIRGERK